MNRDERLAAAVLGAVAAEEAVKEPLDVMADELRLAVLERDVALADAAGDPTARRVIEARKRVIARPGCCRIGILGWPQFWFGAAMETIPSNDLATPSSGRSRSEMAKTELARRAVRASLAKFATLCGFPPARHHRAVIEALEKVSSGETELLLVHMPPGSAKSTLISWLWPVWHFANHPRDQVLFSTHSDEMCGRWGRKVRNTIAEHAATLGLELESSNASVTNWRLRSGGEYRAVSAEAAITGERCDIGIIDDAYGSRDIAWSETVRKRRWEWFVADFSSRLKVGGRRVLCGYRWHLEDLYGLIAEQIAGGLRGEVLALPAFAEEGDPLGREVGQPLWDDDPDYDYPSVLRARQRETPPLEWSALYQQRPVPDTGDYFKSSWFVYHDNLPDRARMRFYGASDYACTSGGGDWTCHVVVGVDHAGKLYLCDLRRMQSDPAEWVEQMCDMVRAWRPWGWAEEGGQIRASVGPFLTARLKERKAHVWRRQFPTRGDKSLRARSIQGRLSMDGISLPRGAPWVPEFLKELLSFPAGRHDDMVDALGLVGQLLDVMQPGAPPEPPKPDQWELPVSVERVAGKWQMTIAPGWLDPAARRKRQAKREDLGW